MAHGTALPGRDEIELEFSGSSKPELWRFQAEPSWGTLIFGLKPSWIEFFKTYFFHKFLLSDVLYHDFNQFYDHLSELLCF